MENLKKRFLRSASTAESLKVSASEEGVSVSVFYAEARQPICETYVLKSFDLFLREVCFSQKRKRNNSKLIFEEPTLLCSQDELKMQPFVLNSGPSSDLLEVVGERPFKHLLSTTEKKIIQTERLCIRGTKQSSQKTWSTI